MARLLTLGAEEGNNQIFYSFAYDPSPFQHEVLTQYKRSGDYAYRSRRGWSQIYFGKSVDEVYARWGFLADGSPGWCMYIGDGSSWNFRLYSQSVNLSIDAPSGTRRYDGTIITQVWYLLEFHIKNGSSDGIFEMKIGGKPVYSATGLNMGTNQMNRLYLTRNNDYNHFWFDDLAINDTSGSYNNSWCGDGHVLALKPNAAGDVTQLLPSSGANWQCVDELPPDGGDATSGSIAGNYDLYNLEALSVNNVNINCVVPYFCGACTVAEGYGVKSGIKTSGSEAWDEDKTYLHNNFWVYKFGDTHDCKPDGTPWEESDIGSLQIGCKLD